jgi:hypothetical protein
MYFGLLKKYNFDHQHIFFLENNYFIELEMRKARDNPQGRAKLEQKRGNSNSQANPPTTRTTTETPKTTKKNAQTPDLKT